MEDVFELVVVVVALVVVFDDEDWLELVELLGPAEVELGDFDAEVELEGLTDDVTKVEERVLVVMEELTTTIRAPETPWLPTALPAADLR